jgi:hypothetical protein
MAITVCFFEDNKKGEDTTKSTELSSDKPKSQPKLKKIFDAFVDALIKFLSRWTSTKEKRLEGFVMKLQFSVLYS